MTKKAATASILASLIWLQPITLHAQDARSTNQAYQQIAVNTCQTYKTSLVNVIRTVSSGVSPDAALERSEPRISSNQQRSLIIEVLEQTAQSEPNQALRAEINRAIDLYKRSGRIEDFERGLSNFTAACVDQRMAVMDGENQTDRQPNNQSNDTNQPGQQAPQRNRGTGTSLPARESYL